jgi:HlyD family secretion protein
LIGKAVRLLGSLTAIGAILGALVYAFWPKPIEVDAAQITKGNLEVSITQDGRTRIKERYVISSPLGGQLDRIELRPGDIVKKGETFIASVRPLSPHLLDSREIAQAEARVKAAEAAVQRSARARQAADASRVFTRSEVERARDVAQQRVISRSELESAEMQFRMRTAELEAATLAEDIAKFELEQARAALLYTQPADQSENRPANLDIKSPIDGRVLRVWEESSKVILPTTPLLEVGDPADLEVEVDVLSSDAVQIKPGTEAWLEHWGGDHDLAGSVRLVEPSGFTKISALGVEEQRVNVIIDLIDPIENRPTLGDGFRVEARIVLWKGVDIMKAPVGSLFRQKDRWAVYKIVDDVIHLVEIEVGHRGGNEVEVLKGLAVGDRVVLHPNDQLKDGGRIVISTDGRKP